MNEEFEQEKISLNNVNQIADVKGNPVVDSVLMPIIKEVPVIGDMIDSSMNKLIEDFQQKKEQELIEVILRDKNTITPDMVNDVEFIVNFAKTKEAVRRLATNDKVKYFGNLIRNGYLSEERVENSVFEEYLDVLNSMSYRQINMLVKYKKFLDNTTFQNRDVDDEWKGFLSSCFTLKYIEEQTEIASIFATLVRTGFVEEIGVREDDARYIPYNKNKYEGDEIKIIGYNLTHAFERFYNMVLSIEDENI